MNLLQKGSQFLEGKMAFLGKICSIIICFSLCIFFDIICFYESFSCVVDGEIRILKFWNLFVFFFLKLFRASSMSSSERMSRISSLENMLSISSNSLVAMASPLSEAEERERAFTNRGRWNQLRSMGDAKNLLQYMFNSLGDARYFFHSKAFDLYQAKTTFEPVQPSCQQQKQEA